MKKKEWIVILAITFGVIMAWIIFDLLHTKASVEVSPEIKLLLEPVDPKFDESVIEKVKNTQKYSLDMEKPLPTVPLEETIEDSQPATSSANLNASPGASINPSPSSDSSPSSEISNNDTENIFIAP